MRLHAKDLTKFSKAGHGLTANPIMATRPTKSSFCLVKPMPPEVPKMPSSTFGFGGGAA